MTTLRTGLPWKQHSNYGRRGGTSATADGRFSVYRIVYPDRTGTKKSTMKAIQPTAKAVCWQTPDGVWHNSGVYDELPAWVARGGLLGPYTIVNAERIG